MKNFFEAEGLLKKTKMTEKRPATEAKESPSPFKLSKADEALIEHVKEERHRLVEGEKRIFASVQVPVAPMSTTAMARCMDNLRCLVTEALTDEFTSVLRFSFDDMEKIFAGIPHVIQWVNAMRDVFVTVSGLNETKYRDSALAWQERQCFELLKPVVEHWNGDHIRFKLQLNNDGIELEEHLTK